MKSWVQVSLPNSDQMLSYPFKHLQATNWDEKNMGANNLIQK